MPEAMPLLLILLTGAGVTLAAFVTLMVLARTAGLRRGVRERRRRGRR